jgi:poly(beta-D-mannuronate) lyase
MGNMRLPRSGGRTRAIRLITGILLAMTPITALPHVEAAHAQSGKKDARVVLVRSQEQYRKVASNVQPGDVIVLANGEWRDFEIVFTGRGTKDKPIALMAQEAGKVIITGRSNLKIGGTHMLVSGLVFRDGYTPTGEVIAFRRSKEDVATESRVTQVVIESFNQPDRTRSDYWVALDGKRNRFDHNTLIGKTNAGVTLAVRLDLEGSRENGHRIDANYFGPRPVLGSNGGETIRIGTSRESVFDSGTLVEGNIFDRTNGEIEIISIKSGANIVRGNLFLEAQGAVTLRHGDRNVIERNVFLGGGKPNTGGIRVINRDQIVRNNYMEGLRGTGFAGALTVMNGVPNSPVNRYVQVSNALIEGNTIVDSARMTLAAGADQERSAPPVSSRMARNLIIFGTVAKPIEVQDDISGIALEGNVIRTARPVTGFAAAAQGEVALERAANGLLYPTDPALVQIGAPRDLAPPALDTVGARHFVKPGPDAAFGTGATIEVADGAPALLAALATAGNGDRLILSPGTYALDQILTVNRTIAIEAGEGARPVLTFSRTCLFELAAGGNLRLKGIDISGAEAPDVTGNAVIATSSAAPPTNFLLELGDVRVRDLTVNRGFDVIAMGKGALAERVAITNSSFANVAGRVLAGESETDDLGRYNAETVTISGSTFTAIAGPVVALYRGGNDESTFGPRLTFEGNGVIEAGTKPLAGSPASLDLTGVQDILIARNHFARSGPLRIVHTTGSPLTRIEDNSAEDTPAPMITLARPDVTPQQSMSGNGFSGSAQ